MIPHKVFVAEISMHKKYLIFSERCAILCYRKKGKFVCIGIQIQAESAWLQTDYNFSGESGETGESKWKMYSKRQENIVKILWKASVQLSGNDFRIAKINYDCLAASYQLWLASPSYELPCCNADCKGNHIITSAKCVCWTSQNVGCDSNNSKIKTITGLQVPGTPWK